MLFHLARVPGESGSLVGTRDEIVGPLKVMTVDEAFVDPRFEPGGQFADFDFSPPFRPQRRGAAGPGSLPVPGGGQRRPRRLARPIRYAATFAVYGVVLGAALALLAPRTLKAAGTGRGQ